MSTDTPPRRPARIVGVHLPRFLIQRRLREDATLAHRPVVVVRSRENVDHVVAASRQALVAGVAPGSTATEAKAACPGLRVLPDDPAADLRALEGLAEALLAASPGVELCGPEGLLADAGSAPLFGGEAGLAQVLADRCRALGYRASLVVADGKFAAWALAVHRPRPVRAGGAWASAVVQGPVAAALAPLPLAALPVPEPLRWALAAMGLKTLGELAALPPAGLAARFGADGALAQRLARGDDPRPLVPLRPAPPLVESLALEWPAETLEPVLFALKTLLDRLTARLSGRGLALTRLEVQLRLEPGGEERVCLPLARPTNAARLLLGVLRERLADLVVRAPVVGVGVEALDTGPAERVQLCVGDRPEVDDALESVLARLRSGLGEQALFSGRPAPRHRPEGAWEPGPFRPGDPDAPLGSRRGPRASATAPATRRPRRAFLARLLAPDAPPPSGKVPLCDDPLLRPGARPTRLLPQPRAVQVELSPTGRIVAVHIGSRRHAAASVHGPERLQGEWWRRGWARDYYRALVAGVGGCWLYRDGRDGQFYLHGYFD